MLSANVGSVGVGRALRVGMIAGLFSPVTLYYRLADALEACVEMFSEPSGAWVLAYAGMAVAVVLAGLALLVARFTKVGAR